jgi:hypothetical protein
MEYLIREKIREIIDNAKFVVGGIRTHLTRPTT